MLPPGPNARQPSLPSPDLIVTKDRRLSGRIGDMHAMTQGSGGGEFDFAGAWRQNERWKRSNWKVRRWLWPTERKSFAVWCAINPRDSAGASSIARCANRITVYASPRMVSITAPTVGRPAIIRPRTKHKGVARTGLHTAPAPFHANSGMLAVIASLCCAAAEQPKMRRFLTETRGFPSASRGIHCRLSPEAHSPAGTLLTREDDMMLLTVAWIPQRPGVRE